MDFEHLSFWSPAFDDESETLGIFSAKSMIAPSPTESEFRSILESLELQFLEGDERANSKGDSRDDHGVVPEKDVSRCGTQENLLGSTGSKNLFSERNRRKRLNQQLLTLRSMVPCISKIDKRSILMDAATYLQSLHQEINNLERDLLEEEASRSTFISTECDSPSPEETNQSDSSPTITKHEITHIEIENMSDPAFVIKIVFVRNRGTPAKVQHMLESLGFQISNSQSHQVDANQMLTTTFIQVNRPGKITSEILQEDILAACVRFGISVDAGSYKNL